MIIRYTEDQFNNSKSRETLPLECERCNQEFHLVKYTIHKVLKGQAKGNTGKYCSKSCARGFASVMINCATCDKTVNKTIKDFKKSNNHFCSRTCAGIHYNQNKTSGTRRSKLESWIEEQLLTMYPDLEFHFNRKDAINSELDIYIPSMKLAFELNGIFHYEPIYGESKLSQIQNNDHRKFAACAEQGISLCIIDTSSQKNFKIATSQRFLDIIVSIIGGHEGNRTLVSA